MNKLNFILCLVLFVLGSQLCFADKTIKQQKNKDTDVEQFIIEQNRVTGDIHNLPLGTVLEKFRVRTGLQYKMPNDMKDELMSVNVDKLDIETALKRILSPYNHVMTKNGKDDYYVVSVLGRKVSVTENTSVDPAGDRQSDVSSSKEPSKESVIEPTDDSPSDVQEIDFDVANRNDGPPPELHDLFYPEMEKGTELTGPIE